MFGGRTNLNKNKNIRRYFDGEICESVVMKPKVTSTTYVENGCVWRLVVGRKI